MKDTLDTIKDLTVEEQLFCSLVSKGESATTAYRKAFPLKRHLKYGSIRTLASRLLTKVDISTEVASKIQTQSRMARLSELRLEEILTKGSFRDKDHQVAQVAMFLYEQANGKATQKLQVESKHVSVNYNLSGTMEAVPQDILDELEDD